MPDGPGRAGGGPGACPRCGGTHLARKGHDGDGSQGRSRGSCGRAPSRRAMGPLGCPEPEGDVRAGRAGHACAGGTLRECAGACGACPGTPRPRAHGAQRGRGPRPCAAREGAAVSCQVDGTRPGESPAGRRPGSAAGMPREPRRCGAVRERGMPDPEVCVVCGGATSAWRHARPEGFLARLGGVPPGRPGHYPGWFLWDERTRRSDADRADTLSGQAATGGYDNTRFALARELQPLWSYWEDKLAMSTVV